MPKRKDRVVEIKPRKKEGPKLAAARNRDELEIMQRREVVAANVLAGATYREIARQLNVSPATIFKDLEAIREEWREHYVADIDSWIKTQLRRYDVLLNAIWSQSRAGTKESLAYLDRVIAIMEKQAKLMGISEKLDVNLDAKGNLGKLAEAMTDAELLRIAALGKDD